MAQTIKKITYITTDEYYNSKVIDYYNEFGIDVNLLIIPDFKITKTYYFSKEILEIIKHSTKKNELIYIDDYLTISQINKIADYTFTMPISKFNNSWYYEAFSLLQTSQTKSLIKEINNFLKGNETFINCNHSINYVDSYNNDIIKDFINAMSIGEVEYKYEKSKIIKELYPNISNRLPKLVNTGESKLVFINHNVCPMDKRLIKETSEQYFPITIINDKDSYTPYHNEYVYLIKLKDMQDEKFRDTLKHSLDTLCQNVMKLRARHINIVFLSYDVTDFEFFSTHQDLFNESLFEYSKKDYQNILALSIFEVNGDTKSLFSNVCVYFNHVLLEGTLPMKLKIPKYLYSTIRSFLNDIRIHSQVKIDDNYFIDASVPELLTSILLPFEDIDEEVC